MKTNVLIARPLWPVLRQIVPRIAADGFLVEEAPDWSRLLDPQLPVDALSAVLLGEYGNTPEELDFLRRFRARPDAPGIPAALVGGRNALRNEAAFREAGIDLLLPADMEAGNLLRHLQPLLKCGSLTRQLLSRNRELHDRTGVDELTGLPNRRQFDFDLSRNVEMARRIGRPLGCIVVDIDNFKKINDAYGRRVGDTVIRQFGTVLAKGKRTYDGLARLGGDEFAWILVDADQGQAARAASRIHRFVAENAFEGVDGSIRLTATFGVSSAGPGVDLSAGTLVGNADRALYWGKESGKNAVRCYPPKRATTDDSNDSCLS